MPSLRRLPSGLWQATVRLPNGRRATKTDTSKQWVRGWGENLESDIRRGTWVDPATVPNVERIFTVGQWREVWMASRHREFNTAAAEDLAWKMRVIQWADWPLDSITRLDVQSWLTQMSRDDVGPTSQHKAIGHLRQLLRAAVAHHRLDTDPTHGVSKPTIPRHVDRILTRQEWAQLDASTGNDPMVRLMVWCGLRWGEAAGLHGTEVDLGRGHLWVIRVGLKNGVLKEYPKSASGHRRLPMPPETIEALKDRHHMGRLFLSPKGMGLNYRNWHRRWGKWLRGADLPNPQPTPHDLRHTFGTWLADGGVPIHDISALMGHSDQISTARYVHSSSGREKKALDALRGKHIIE